jgi:hypothetical protein
MESAWMMMEVKTEVEFNAGERFMDWRGGGEGGPILALRIPDPLWRTRSGPGSADRYADPR